MPYPPLDEVLKEVNRFRKQHRLGDPLDELPVVDKTELGDNYTPSLDCVIAKATGGRCGVTYAVLSNDRTVRMPDLLSRFIEAFDSGEYPELVR